LFRKIYGKHVYTTRVLPHALNDDIVVAFSMGEQAAVEVDKDTLSFMADHVHQVEDLQPNLIFMVVMAPKRHDFLGDGTYGGPLASRVRQLKACGYKVAVFRHYLYEAMKRKGCLASYLDEEIKYRARL